jgi:hypothetical protein
MKRVRSSLSAFLLTIFTVQAQAVAQKHIQTLKLAGDILWFAEGDLNQDQYRDLVVSYRRGSGINAKRFLAVFFRSIEGLPTHPQAAFLAPANAVAFDLADVIGDASREIVYLAQDGVYAQVVTRNHIGQPIRIIKHQSLVGRAEHEDFLHWHFVNVIDGQTTVILPNFNAISLYRRNKSLYELWSRIELQTANFYDTEHPSYVRAARGGRSGKRYALSATTIIPLLRFIDQSGDGKADLIAHFEDRLQVYVQDKDGRIPSKPTHERWLNMRTTKERASRDSSLEVQVLDLNQDGIADISASKISGGVLNMRSETRIYAGLKGGGFTKEPIQVFKDEGFAVLVRYIDVNRDGRLEMIHPHASPTLFALSRVLLTSELSVDFRVRYFSKQSNQFFIRAPGFETTSLLGLDFKTGGALHGPYPLFGGDFNHDQKPDLAFGQGDKKFIILWGQKKGILNDERSSIFKIKSTRETHLLHPHPNQADEIMFVYKHHAKYAGTIKVLRFR